jgi:hypothetical protein
VIVLKANAAMRTRHLVFLLRTTDATHQGIVVPSVVRQYLIDVFKFVLDLMMVIDLDPREGHQCQRQCHGDDGRGQTREAELTVLQQDFAAPSSFSSALNVAKGWWGWWMFHHGWQIESTVVVVVVAMGRIRRQVEMMMISLVMMFVASQAILTVKGFRGIRSSCRHARM